MRIGTKLIFACVERTYNPQLLNDGAIVMTLKLYPTGFSSSDQLDQSVRSGEWLIGRIWKDPNPGEDLCWRWSLFAAITGPRGIRRLGRAATFDNAKEQLIGSWSKLLAWANLTEFEERTADDCGRHI
jgi:hypothetical protein